MDRRTFLLAVRFRVRASTLALIATVLICVAFASSANAQAQAVSTLRSPVVNESWAGYDVLAAARTTSFRPYFTRVAGSWTQPLAVCTRMAAHSPSHGAQASVWVGLGGAANVNAVFGPLQIGTDSDCTKDGHPFYYAWYEAYPHGEVFMRMRIHAGDSMSALVVMSASGRPTVALRDNTTAASFYRTLPLHVRTLASESAEWVIEGPWWKVPPLLTDFGDVTFTGASATQISPDGTHTGSISDPAWRAVEPNIISGNESGFYEPNIEHYAAPSALSADGSGFTIAFGALATVAGFISSPA
jgi:hypothetical protein